MQIRVGDAAVPASEARGESTPYVCCPKGHWACGGQEERSGSGVLKTGEEVGVYFYFKF